MSSNTPSRAALLSLPPELRDAIHRLLVVDPHEPILKYNLHNTRHLSATHPLVKDVRCPCATDRPVVTHQHLHGPGQPALSMTCRELRAEVFPIFYGENRILIEPPSPYGAETPRDSNRVWWLSTPPFQAAARYISHVSIDTRVWIPHRRTFEDPGPGVQFSSRYRSSGPRAGIIELEISGEQAEKRCYCQVRAFVEGLNARETLSTETQREVAAARSCCSAFAGVRAVGGGDDEAIAAAALWQG